MIGLDAILPMLRGEVCSIITGKEDPTLPKMAPSVTENYRKLVINKREIRLRWSGKW